jgi:membrane protein DedA with SNARE-associated domain
MKKGKFLVLAIIGALLASAVLLFVMWLIYPDVISSNLWGWIALVAFLAIGGAIIGTNAIYESLRKKEEAKKIKP